MPKRPAAEATRSISVRMSDGDFDPVEARASRLGISTSQALRELVGLGALLEHAETAGWRISHGVHELLTGDGTDGAGVVVRIAPDPDDPAGPTWMVTPEEVHAHEAAS